MSREYASRVKADTWIPSPLAPTHAMRDPTRYTAIEFQFAISRCLINTILHLCMYVHARFSRVRIPRARALSRAPGPTENLLIRSHESACVHVGTRRIANAFAARDTHSSRSWNATNRCFIRKPLKFYFVDFIRHIFRIFSPELSIRFGF